MRVVIRFVLVASIFAARVTFGQLITPPPLDWQAGFGGTGDDIATTIVPAATGGYLVAGFSDSTTNGNKTAPNYGSFDYWVVRLDAFGNRLWDRSYGGATNDLLQSVVATSDGGLYWGDLLSLASVERRRARILACPTIGWYALTQVAMSFGTVHLGGQISISFGV
jgi:hypothetical protein